MTALEISLAANLILTASLMLFAWRYGHKIREAKIATFAEMLRAISYSAACKDADVRFERMAIALRPMLGSVDVSEIRWRLLRAAMIGYFGSRAVTMADTVNGAGRLLILKQVAGTNKADEVWERIDAMLADPKSLEDIASPSDEIPVEDMKLAQMQLEAELVRSYGAALATNNVA